MVEFNEIENNEIENNRIKFGVETMYRLLPNWPIKKKKHISSQENEKGDINIDHIDIKTNEQDDIVNNFIAIYI